MTLKGLTDQAGLARWSNEAEMIFCCNNVIAWRFIWLVAIEYFCKKDRSAISHGPSNEELAYDALINRKNVNARFASLSDRRFIKRKNCLPAISSAVYIYTGCLARGYIVKYDILRA